MRGEGGVIIVCGLYLLSEEEKPIKRNTGSIMCFGAKVEGGEFKTRSNFVVPEMLIS